jgi:hypothetical protein
MGRNLNPDQERLVQDTRILQKVNRVHREAFLEKFPAQTEHCLRLVMERLQAGLDKRDGCDVSNPETWRMTTIELRDLAETAHQLNQIRLGFQE